MQAILSILAYLFIVFVIWKLIARASKKTMGETNFLEDSETEYFDKIKTIKRDIGHRVKPTLPL